MHSIPESAGGLKRLHLELAHVLVAVPGGSGRHVGLGAPPHEVSPLQVGLHDHVHAPLGVREVQGLARGVAWRGVIDPVQGMTRRKQEVEGITLLCVVMMMLLLLLLLILNFWLLGKK